ncbi:YkvA family protein [Methanocella sp. MCL-LM]|uniref:YkvA family protein n=1 Tax=Methanocella sp. MCL-LM TaxID=3412035 RepID=UPI003C73622E
MEGIQVYEQNYSESRLWYKINKYSKVVGASIVYHALLLWYIATKDSTPVPVKLLILGGLGYFIAPIEAIPDFLVGIGYGDDAALLMGIFSSVMMHMDDDSKSKAKVRVKEIFGDGADIVSPFS